MRRLTALLLLLAVACHGDSTTTPSSVAGTWSLQTINGTALPYVLSQTATDKFEVLGDVYTLSSAGSFTETSTTRTTSNGVVTTDVVPDGGTYTLNGSAVSLRYSDGFTVTGSWSGNSMTITDGGFAFVYSR